MIVIIHLGKVLHTHRSPSAFGTKPIVERCRRLVEQKTMNNIIVTRGDLGDTTPTLSGPSECFFFFFSMLFYVIFQTSLKTFAGSLNFVQDVMQDDLGA